MSNNVELDEFHGHEALDRTHLIMSMIDDHLLTHAYVEHHEDVKDLLEQASTKLAEAFQLIGSKTL